MNFNRSVIRCVVKKKRPKQFPLMNGCQQCQRRDQDNEMVSVNYLFIVCAFGWAVVDPRLQLTLIKVNESVSIRNFLIIMLSKFFFPFLNFPSSTG